MTTGSTSTVRIPNVPAGAVAVQLNVTAAGVSRTSYISACAGGTPVEACRATSALNPAAGVDTASGVLVSLGGPAGDEVTLYNNQGDLSVSADVHGFYVEDDATAARFLPQAPTRALDRVVGPGEPYTLTLTGVPAGATAVAVNVTTSGASAVSYVSACPADQPLASCVASSTTNATPARDRANLAVVKLGGPEKNQLTLYNNRGSLRLVVDVAGYFVQGTAAPAQAGWYTAVTPVRVLSFQPMGHGSAHTVTLPNVPSGATAVAMNLTSTAAGGVTYISACPGGTALTVCSAASAFNPVPGVDTSNSTMLKLGGPYGNQVTFYNNRGTVALIADVQGYFIGGA